MAQLETPPEINYLAKDYAGFRQLLLDHLSLWLPGWTEEHPADLGHALVEVLAYAADYLSYYQDAVATEAYLGTARLRRSVKRHVRLLNYDWHEGCNARVWVQVQVKKGESVTLRKGTQLLTRLDGGGTEVVIQPESAAYHEAKAQAATFFETMLESTLHGAHNELPFHTPRLNQGTERRKWLKEGATSTVLHVPEREVKLKVGQVLIFEEIRNPQTGRKEDADPKHRHAVRLTHVTRLAAESLFGVEYSECKKDLDDLSLSKEFRQKFERNGITLSKEAKVVKKDEKGKEWRIEDKDTNKVYIVSNQGEELDVSAPRMKIEWNADDALPFDLCLAACYDGTRTEEMSVALGNIVLADHGRTIRNEELLPWPGTGRYYPHLRHTGLTFSEPFHRGRAVLWSAQEMLSQEPRRAMPDLTLCELATAPLRGEGRSLLPLLKLGQGTYPIKPWTVRPELMSSGTYERDYTIEIEDDGRAYLRFGFAGAGWRPEVVDARFVATYRIGNGSAGNVGRDTIAHIVPDEENAEPITQVRNPLPAQGGTERVRTEEARQHAPLDYRSSPPCVTESDYAQAAKRHSQVAAAVAQIHWTGSRHTAFVYVQRRGGRPVDEEFRRELADFMERYRLAGCDLEIRGPRLVPLEIALGMYVKPGHQAGVVIAALKEAFSDRTLPDEKVGFFHPDCWTFGQAVYRSQVIASAMDVPGVARVEVDKDKKDKFRRMGADHDDDPIPIGPLEIVRLRNDPGDPSQGTIEFKKR